jgi:lysozyme family protein
MAKWTYDEALRRLLAHEGGYSNHPSDPGGPTKFGITIHDYRKYIDAGGTAANVRAMTVDQAKAIYRDKYWNAMRCDALPAGVDYCIFDYAVNSGTGRAPKVLQRVLGIAVSGRMDERTLAAARARDARALIGAICDERLRFLRALRTWPVFGKGWSRRVREVRAAALAMATSAPTSRTARDVVGVRQPAPGKGEVPLNRPAQTGTAAGACAAGGAAAAHGGEPAIAVLILVATIAVAVGGYFFWRWWQRRQQEAAA